MNFVIIIQSATPQNINTVYEFTTALLAKHTLKSLFLYQDGVYAISNPRLHKLIEQYNLPTIACRSSLAKRHLEQIPKLITSGSLAQLAELADRKTRMVNFK